MLKELSISNFKSFNEEQTFSMEAAPKSEISEYYDDHVLNFKNEHLLKVSSFYGPNGGGKSNLLQALSLLRQVAIGGYGRSARYSSQSSYSSCVFNESESITLTAFFVNNKYELGYSVSFHFVVEEVSELEFERKYLMTFIEKEELSCRDLDSDVDEILYSRNAGNLKSNLLNDLDIFKRKNLLSQTVSVLSYITSNYYGFAHPRKVKSNLDERIISIINEFGSFIFLPDMIRIEMFPSRFENRSYKDIILNHKKDLITLMKNADLEIDDIEYIEKDDNAEVNFVVNGKRLSLENNSKGTRKYFALIARIIEAKNCIVIADDFDANFHPRITRAIIEYFNSKNNKTNQFIFNSHDIINMDNKLFRRDEIWFAYRNDNKSTIIIPLSNIVDFQGKQIRKDAVYGKQYLEGKYGGDPFVKKGLNWGN